MTVRGKVIVITGAARGVGQAVAAAFCKEGANVLAADIRNCERTKTLALGCEGRIEIAHLDVTDQQSAQAAVAQAVSARPSRCFGQQCRSLRRPQNGAVRRIG
jgi:NAD(P)-dependent dehydrogenase (short-subunit alcohol dehydrogenase family)